jgi:hypothetical protein
MTYLGSIWTKSSIEPRSVMEIGAVVVGAALAELAVPLTSPRGLAQTCRCRRKACPSFT